MENKQRESPVQINKRASPSGKESTFVIYGNNGSGLIEQILLELGWKKLADKNSDGFKLKWVENKSSVNYDAFKEGEQLVNRIPNCFLLTNKLGLLTSLQRYERVWTMLNLGRIIKLRTSDFIPETYRLDDSTERRIFLEIFKPSDIWICKPTGLNQGRGIFLVRSLEEFRKSVTEREELEKKQQRPAMERVIQRYVTNPLLLDGKKFDIRVFMLVANTAPFLILFHKGYARLCLQTYNNQAEDLTAHLTNQFVQKRDATYEYCKEETVWSIEKLNNYINKKVAPVKGLENDWVLNTLTNQMKQIMLYCFHAVKHKLKSRVGYFDLYGLDFLVDDNMKVWLIEINANPCLATNCDTLKEVIPSVVRETLYLAIECFEKSRRSLPLYPLHTLKNFQILFNGSHSSAYLHPNYPSLKRSWSLVSAGLCNIPSTDGQDKDDDKTAKDFSRNYMTSIVFESPDEHNCSPVPVSMFDLNKIESRKLLVNCSDLTNSLPSSQKSLTSLTQNTNPINFAFMKSKQQESDKETDFSRKREFYENLGKGKATMSPVIDGLPKDQKISEKLSEDQKPDTPGKDKVILEKSGNDRMLLENLSNDHTTEKSNEDRPTSEVSNKDQTILEKSSKHQVTDLSTSNQTTLEMSAQKQNVGDQLTANKLKGLIISDKFSRGRASWERTSSSVAQQTDDQDTSEMQSARSLFDLSRFRSITSASKSKANTEDPQPSISAKLKAEELYPTFLNLSASAKPAKQLKPQNQTVGTVRAKSEETGTSGTVTRNVSKINSFMKPIQFLSSNLSLQEKKSGPLDLIVEQLEKDVAKAKMQQAMLRPNREYRLVNTDIFGNSISDNNMMRNYYYPTTNQDYAFNSLKSHESSRAADKFTSRFQYADRSKMLSSKIYPPASMNFFPGQENKSYLSPNVLSAYSFTNAKNRNIPSSDYEAYPSAEGRNLRVNLINPRKSMPSEYTEGPANRFSVVRGDKPPEKYSEIIVDKKSWELNSPMLYKESTKIGLKEIMHSPTDATENFSSEYNAYPSSEGRKLRVNQIRDRKSVSSSEGPANRFSIVRADKPPEKYSEIVDKKSWELKGQMLYKEATKNVLKDMMHSPTDAMENEYNTGVWNQAVLGHSGTKLQDAGGFPASRLLKGYTSHGAWNGSVRVFPDPDIWLAGLHKTTGNQATFSRPQNMDKDWGHFTVISPK